ncbi:nucleotide exchange factor GrpE [Nonomuraea sp. NPDC050790]|uniref:nucleotide exchange factor GrpE n=1 Tax=Nonomuraea sp. NPDC050790 TaxID=3364371 RepID=UPI00378B1C3A
MSEELSEKLDVLTDLFKRRLSDDRDKRMLLEEQARRIQQAEGGLFRDLQLPLVLGVAAVIDRIDRHPGEDREFALDIRDELIELLAVNGIREVATDSGFDRATHEAAAARPEEGVEPGTVLEVWSRGYARHGWVFRPARVVVAL